MEMWRIRRRSFTDLASWRWC